MISKKLKLPIYLLFLIGIIVACQKEIIENRDIEVSSFDILKAKAWFENSYSNKLMMGAKNREVIKMPLEADWECALLSETDVLKILEIPLTPQESFGFYSSEDKSVFKETGDKRFLQSKTNLVILSNKINNKITGFLMTIIPDNNYRIATEYKSYNSTYMKWQKGFSGYVLYHTIEGTYANGWRFLDGKVVSTVYTKKRAEIETNFKPRSKSIEDYEACHDYALVAWYAQWNGSTWEISSEIVYTFSVCVTVSSGDSSGGYVPADTPCKGDPLRYFSIASSGASGVAGGMYGCVRIGNEARCNYTKQYHGGIDLACPLNTELHPMKNGLVLEVVDTYEPGFFKKRSLGNYVKVRYISGDGSTTDITYAHLNYVFVEAGTYITENQILGLSGDTGNASEPSVPEDHVHIETFQDGVSVDPAGYFRSYISPNGDVFNPCDVN